MARVEGADDRPASRKPRPLVGELHYFFPRISPTLMESFSTLKGF
jgi:hypothetical protein